MTMCSNRHRILTLAVAGATGGLAVAQPPPHMEAKKPFAFSPGGGPVVPAKVWSAVVLASKAKQGEKPAPLPSELAPFAKQLTSFLGYDQFKILGAKTEVMDKADEHWIVPTKNFWLSTQATRAGTGYRVTLEFFHDKRPLLKTEAVLGPGSPLFIRGPEHVSGQIIMVFEVKP